MAETRTVIVIPARYGSSRFPGKPLALIGGRPMIEWVHRRACATRCADEVLVATDDDRIAQVVTAFGGRVAFTRADHETGTDRIAEAVQGCAADLVVNLQGDEPLMPPELIDELVDKMRDSGAEMGTVAMPFGHTERSPDDPNAVKVVIDVNGLALYFSRALIPYPRDGGSAVEPLLHWGLYAYRRAFLEQFVRWPQSVLERCEMLEQLRALEHGARIQVVTTTAPNAGVDVPADIEMVERILGERGEL